MHLDMPSSSTGTGVWFAEVSPLVIFGGRPMQPLPAVVNHLPLCPTGFLFRLAGSSNQTLPSRMRGGGLVALCAPPSSRINVDEVVVPMRASFGPLEFLPGYLL
jgi:hypothetical protein